MDPIFKKRDTAWRDIKSRYEKYAPIYYPVKYTNEYKFSENIKHNNVYNVMLSDSLDLALSLKNPLVLIFADDVSPGGCVDSGNGMQEESLFRRTALFKYLSKDFYPLSINQAIYCKDVPVCKNSNLENIETIHISFIACPCIKMPGAPISSEEINILKQKIHLIFKIACANGHKNVVLGAWGCGVWGCNPKDIAMCIKEISVCYNLDLFFPILNKGHNFEIFKETFS